MIAAAALGTREVLRAIPHRFPMLMIDRVDELVPGVSGVGIKNVTSNEPFFQGHFPGEPIFPGVLLIESMAQAAAVVLQPPDGPAAGGGGSGGLRYLMAVEKAVFRRPVVPGDCLVIEVAVLRRFGGMARVKAHVKVRDVEVASAELALGSGRG